MRTKTLLLILLMAANAATAQWTKLTNGYTGLDLFDIHAHGDRIIAVGYTFSNFQGHWLKSDDGGKNWNLIPYNPGQLFKTIVFKDADTGFVGGFGSITALYRTTDGGQNWNLFLQDFDNSGISDMHFLSDKIAVAAGYAHDQFFSGQCYRTLDGGHTWTSIDSADLGCLDTTAIDYVQFVDAQTGYGRADLFGARTLVKTTDSGKSWNLIYTHTMGMAGTHFWNANNGIMIDNAGKVFKTTNGGQNWTATGKTVASTLLTMNFLNQTLGFAAGAGVIYKTTDGGENWIKEPTVAALAQYRRIRFFDNRAYLTSTNGIIVRSEVLPNNVNDVLPLAEQMNIYPNPANDALTISSYNGVYKNIDAVITSLDGRSLRSASTNDGMLKLDVADLPSGNYTLELNVDGRQTSRVISIAH